jgi:hypothetical protein
MTQLRRFNIRREITMNTAQIDEKQKELPQSSQVVAPENFDFDHWAGAVKRQMIASLRKRGDRTTND